MNVEFQDTAQPTQRTPRGEASRWYVLVARYRKEIAVRDELRGRGFEAYVPLQYGLTRSKVRRRVLKPAINGLVFARATMPQLFDYKHSSPLGLYVFFRSIRRDYYWEPLVVRDDAMANFIQLTSITDQPLQYFRPDELRLEKGDEVRIMDGAFKGIVGRIQRLPRRKGEFLVVELPGATTVAARLKPQYVEPLVPRVAPSQHVDADVRRLDEVATTLLYKRPSDTDGEPMLATLKAELQTLRQSLQGARLVMNSDRVAYHLAHLLASLAMGEDQAARAPMAEVIRQYAPKLKASSLLRQRAAIYLSLLYHDNDAEQFLSATIHVWKPETATQAQRKAMAEWRQAKAVLTTF